MSYYFLSWNQSPHTLLDWFAFKTTTSHLRHHQPADTSQTSRDTANRGLTKFANPKPHFRTNPSDHGKASSTSPHDPLGITDSACKNQSVMVSVQYGPFNTNIPIRSMTIGKPINRGLTKFANPKPHFRTNPSDHGKASSTSPHDPLGITDSACKNQSVMVSVQYGPFNTNIPIRSMTIGKSRVARDLITMHTSWRSNSDIACVTRRLDPTSFTRKLALQRLATVVLRIRSTIGNTTPSSVCTRRADEFTMNGISSSWWSEQVQPRRRRHMAAARRRVRAAAERESGDSIGYPRTKASGESSKTKHRLLRASGPHPIPPPNDPN
ncbi:hypothetical protein F511_14883 [Dorcoceras hygrometricum]|uniref:Uncharacterized protein n=1 Tax=Dorcoceras hygrometricum TaxID=472368 RepID=A0A2Z7BYY8_9LAMI|nr:hypothetical protein F511_14883 [Dorcoceras hygrometricum]